MYAWNGRVLDIGCGSGIYGTHLASMGCDVLQLDIEDRRLDGVRHLPFLRRDARELGFKDDSFDCILAFDIMEHLDDDMRFLSDVRRICRHRLLLSVPNGDDALLTALGVTHKHHSDKTHRRDYTKARLADILSANGFRVLRIDPHYNTQIPRFARALQRPQHLSRLAATLLCAQCRLFLRLGIFRNNVIGDWYCVADVD